ncbi:MAG: thioredoxin-dependent thiol peroxidase [Chitinophagales bacterium]|nr:thioredoxin-dependent thiol peroxidase [Chitinophagales bacterium]MCO5279615.1 thioredoxin-dependent thiol peroxidase [Chitinophagales bacterium]OJV24166.1 MAG: peroxiredoxin [Bacteroidetes bacterium 37-13]HRN93892.1 thioredoxin-dependent thiol peroxidase [Chitinophagales bacterium]HRP39978.1 thioredoxin-dependent thiol peroxidase [Chitinophagales bacterium]
MLQTGDKAPDFSALNQDGETVSLKDFKGKKVILYFYPKDNTPGCTKQACSLRDGYSQLKKAGFEILGVSVDSVKSHKKFEEKFELPFTLISDETKEIVEKYSVWGKKKFMGREYMGTFRKTFVINEKGIIQQIIDKVEVSDAANQILNLK